MAIRLWAFHLELLRHWPLHLSQYIKMRYGSFADWMLLQFRLSNEQFLLSPPRIGPFLPDLPHFMCTRSPTCILSLNAASHTLYAKESALWYFLQVLVGRPHLTSYTKRFVVLKGFFIAGSFTTSPSPLTPVCSAIYFLFYVHIKSDRHWNLKQTSDFQVQECSDF